MATYQVIDSYPPFEYGSAVCWRTAHQKKMNEGSIFGFDTVDTVEKAAATGLQLGAVLALIESESGSDSAVPLCELMLV